MSKYIQFALLSYISMSALGYRLNGTKCQCDETTVFTVNAVKPNQVKTPIGRLMRMWFPFLIGLCLVFALMESFHQQAIAIE